MAADLLTLLIKTNLAAAAAIAMALCLRKPARKAFGARIAYALWLIVPLAVGASLLPARAVVLSPIDPSGAVGVAEVVSPTGDVLTAPATSTPLVDGPDLLVAMWLAGAVLSFVLLTWRQARFIKSLGGLIREGRVYRAEACIAGPAVIGALFPRIVLPADFETRYDAREQKIIIAHEAAHLASGDALVNAVAALAQCLGWFNPMIHVAARLMRVDQELACDAAVLAAFPNERRPYAETLLKTQIATTPLPIGCYWPAGPSNPLKERIAMLTLATPSRTRRLCGGAGVLALCLGAGFAAWAAQPAKVTRASLPVSVAVSPNAAAQAGAADVASKAFYRLAVTLPNGTIETLTSPRLPGPITGPEITKEFRAAQLTYLAALREDRARTARGAPPQPLTPKIQSAFEALREFERVATANRRAGLVQEYQPINVASAVAQAEGHRFGLHVPKPLTAEAKARSLARVDSEIAQASGPRKEFLIEARAVLAQKPTEAPVAKPAARAPGAVALVLPMPPLELPASPGAR